MTKQLPDVVQKATAKIDEYARGMISGTGSTLFEELGLYYIGPLDGHNVDDLVAVLEGERLAGGAGRRGPGALAWAWEYRMWGAAVEHEAGGAQGFDVQVCMGWA